MNTRARFVAVAVAATALTIPATAAAGEAALKYTGCPNGKLKIWGANGAVWTTADFTECNSAVDGKDLTVKLYRNGSVVAANANRFRAPIIVIGFKQYEAHAATAVTFDSASTYRACAFIGTTQLTDCADK